MKPFETHPVHLSDQALIKESIITKFKRGGPGGQHRNKVETAIRVTHQNTQLMSEANERRSQEENRRVAMKRLRRVLAIMLWNDYEPPETPSQLWNSRVHNGKISINSSHEDYDLLLAEVLSFCGQHHWDVPQTAKTLNLSTSQLVKFLKKEPRAFVLLNQQRELHGRKPLA